MRASGRGSAMELWACLAQVFPGFRAGDALCPVILLWSMVNGAYHC